MIRESERCSPSLVWWPMWLWNFSCVFALSKKIQYTNLNRAASTKVCFLDTRMILKWSFGEIREHFDWEYLQLLSNPEWIPMDVNARDSWDEILKYHTCLILSKKQKQKNLWRTWSVQKTFNHLCLSDFINIYTDQGLQCKAGPMYHFYLQ